MSVVTSRTRTVTHHEWLVPVPAAAGDFLEAVDFAMRRYRETFGAGTLHDDWAHISHDDENVIIGFTTEERA
ncbi:hypothetical protein ACFWU5_16770 [Nocardia sp. NPDC058640]|uniref:hypothetical protein n=1 Tax=Nocardia sp. NPDC058640 TaxID=3346571 RepID=UPI0036689B01